MKATTENLQEIHIDDVDGEVRAEVRERLVSSLESTFFLAGIDATVDEIFVKGSFEKGEAIPHESDLDLRVVVQCEKQPASEIIKIEQSIRRKLSDIITDDTPFKYIDPNCVRVGSPKAKGEIPL